MKHAKTIVLALAVTAFTGWATMSFACGDQGAKSAKAAASGGASACSAEQAAQCSAAQAAACKLHGASAVTADAKGASGCPYHDAMVKAAESGPACCAGKTSSAAVTAAGGGAGKVSAVAAGYNCGSKTSAAANAKSAGSASCEGQGAARLSANSKHGDCDACAEMSGCQGQLDEVGAVTQVVPLKNGVMLVYTAGSKSGVLAVQSAISRRHERMAMAVTAGDQMHLCGKCRAMRGAAASGKLSREVVNIEGGCLTLMTSSDPIVVAKIYEMAGLESPTRIKS